MITGHVVQIEKACYCYDDDDNLLLLLLLLLLVFCSYSVNASRAEEKLRLWNIECCKNSCTI